MNSGLLTKMVRKKPLHEIKDIEEDISALDDLNIDFPKELLKTLNNDSTKNFRR